MDWNSIFEWIGIFTVVLVPVGSFVLWFGKTYIDKWLTKHFQGQLDALKHTQAQEIERLRAKIAGMLDRATKLHQHEFEVLPKAWDLLTSALGSVQRVTARDRTAVNVGAMSQEDLEVLLRDSPLEEHERQSVRDAGSGDKKMWVLRNLMDRHEFQIAHRDTIVFHNYVLQLGIFIEPEIRWKLREAASEMKEALTKWKPILEMPEIMPWPIEEANAHVNKANDLSREIEQLISDRLWNASRLDA
ncbi:MAG: hypothetical protein ACK41P_10515 [Asticcacaulis sp.]